nr:pectate lyase [Candidatus Sigynarchaeota archaeon]
MKPSNAFKQVLLITLGLSLLVAMIALSIMYRYDFMLVPFIPPTIAGVFLLITPLAVTVLVQGIKSPGMLDNKRAATTRAIIHAGCVIAAIPCFILSFVAWWNEILFDWLVGDPILFALFLTLFASGFAANGILAAETFSASKGRSLFSRGTLKGDRGKPAQASILAKTSAVAILAMLAIVGIAAGVFTATEPDTCNRQGGYFSDPAYDLPSGNHFPVHANTLLDSDLDVNQTILDGLERALWNMTRLQRAGGFPIGCYLDGIQYSDRGDGCPLFNDEFSLQSGTPLVGQVYLEMYKLENNSDYLDVAKKVADALVAVQDEVNGGFFYDGRRHGENGAGYQPHPRNPNRANVLDDNVMQGCMEYLIDFYNLAESKGLFNATERQRYMTAIDNGLQCLVDTEKASGGWPQCSEYPLYMYESRITLNDGAMEDTVNLLIKACTVFPGKNATLLPMIERAGQFLIRVQGNGGSPTQHGWAQQYDERTGMPCWGRNFEPPSFSSTDGTGSAIRILTSICVFTHNKSYLASIPLAIEWLDNSRVNYTEDDVEKDGWSRLYELQTNTPIFGLSYGGPYRTPEYGYAPEREGYDWYTSMNLEKMNASYCYLASHTIPEYITYIASNRTLSGTLGDAQDAFAALNPDSYWLEDGDHIRDKVFNGNAMDMIRYLQLAIA